MPTREEIAANMKKLEAHPLVAKYGGQFNLAAFAEWFPALEPALDFAASALAEAESKATEAARIRADRDLTPEAKQRRLAELVESTGRAVTTYFDERLETLRANLARTEEELRRLPGGDPAASAVAEIGRQFRLRYLLDKFEQMQVSDILRHLLDAAETGDALPFVALSIAIRNPVPADAYRRALDRLNDTTRPDAVSRVDSIKAILGATTRLADAVAHHARAMVAAERSLAAVSPGAALKFQNSGSQAA